MTTYSVYVHRNKVNGKMYFGLTGQQPRHRWGREGSGYKSNDRLYTDILGYGWESFSHAVLRTFTSRKLADEYERLCIEVYQTDNPENGYNITGGGFLGNAIAGGEAIAAKKRRPVCQYDLKGMLIAEYSGANIAAREVLKKKRSSALVDVCNGKRGTCYGYVWRYKGDPFDKYNVFLLKQKREVLQYDKAGAFIRKYDSIADATRETFTRHSEIIRACRGKRHTAGGYIWKYAEVI